MNTEELMIGDFVYYEPESMPIQVEEVRGDAVQFHKRSALIAFEDEIQPMPITEEILELNGFINDEIAGSWWLKQPNIEVFGNNRYGWMIFSGIQIKYVHELQHALRLCGKYELADNLKVEEK